ncbi:beta-N-acetylhexosaminidase [Candidatus Nitrospira bockiana]
MSATTLREKVGELFMLGFSGTAVTPDLVDLVKTYHPGGFILFARNLQSPEQAVALTNALQAHAGHTPFLIAIDQEGGRVSRLPAGFTIFPACAVVGRCGSTKLAYEVAAVTAAELRAVGINMNMAPVLDINTNADNPVIGDRAFSAKAGDVAELGLATIAGLQDNRVVACGKHFPGHGETSVDSHLELPVVSATLERLHEVELRPFRHAIANGVATIMTAHVSYPSLDPQFPATLSYIALTDLLRDHLRFKGVIVTDDLEMHAIVDHYGIEEAAVTAFQAGADVLLICKGRDRAVAAMEAVYRAVKDGTIAEGRLDASLRRLAHLKERFLLPYAPLDPRRAAHIVGCQAHQAVLAALQHTTERASKATV